MQIAVVFLLLLFTQRTPSINRQSALGSAPGLPLSHSPLQSTPTPSAHPSALGWHQYALLTYFLLHFLNYTANLLTCLQFPALEPVEANELWVRPGEREGSIGSAPFPPALSLQGALTLHPGVVASTAQAGSPGPCFPGRVELETSFTKHLGSLPFFYACEPFR